MIKIVRIICLLAVVLVGCSQQSVGDDASQPIKQDIPSAQADELTQAPFTGEQVVQSTMRPVLVTINNHVAARPQAGLAAADIVFEMLAEGEVTRLLALYQSELPPLMGPIRSARDYFITIAQGLDAFYVAHGYSPDAEVLLGDSEVDHINGMTYDGTLFTRSTARKAPHNSYITSDNLLLGAQTVNAPMQHKKKLSYAFYDEQENVKIGKVASYVSVRYGKQEAFNSTYSYDASTKTYTRYTADEATIDENSGQALSLANVIFFEMDHRIIDDRGRREINLTSGGKALLAQQGMLREVSWKNDNGLLVPVESNGDLVQLIPGQTWIHFVPTSLGIDTAVSTQQ